jgi:hypothetical protein
VPLLTDGLPELLLFPRAFMTQRTIGLPCGGMETAPFKISGSPRLARNTSGEGP